MKNRALSICILIAMLAAGGVTYWSNYESWVTLPRVRAAFADHLRDPSSAQFRNDRLLKSGTLCGEVNAKNGMGGYVGFKRFISSADGSLYIEDSGVLGEWSTPDVLAMMDEKIAMFKQRAKWRSEGVDVPAYSEREAEDAAKQRFFLSKWTALCAVTKS